MPAVVVAVDMARNRVAALAASEAVDQDQEPLRLKTVFSGNGIGDTDLQVRELRIQVVAVVAAATLVVIHTAVAVTAAPG
jgi:hypothetical protein